MPECSHYEQHESQPADPRLIYELAVFALRNPAEEIMGFNVVTAEQFEAAKDWLRMYPESDNLPQS